MTKFINGPKRYLALPLVFSAASINADISGTALIVDGDTVTISGNKIRLNGIDTPEKDQTCRRAGVTWRCGYEATETLKNWTYTKNVNLRSSPSTDAPSVVLGKVSKG